MTNLTDTDKTFLDALKAAADESPDFVYPRDERPSPTYRAECTYVVWEGERDEDQARYGLTPTDQPSCIVGKALMDSGLATAKQLADHEGEAARMVVQRFGVSHRVGSFANEVQQSQDRQDPWGQAFNDAIADDWFNEIAGYYKKENN